MLFESGRKIDVLAYLEQKMDAYPEIFEHSPDILLFVVDLNGVIINVRGGTSRLIGIVPNEIIGKEYCDFIYKEDLQKVEALLSAVLAGETRYESYRIMDKEGKAIPIDITLTPIRMENGEVIGFYGLTHNISTEYRLQEQVEELQGRIHSLIDHSHEVIGILDAEGTFIFESPSIESILGYTVKEITGQSSFDYIHPDDLPIMNRKFKELLLRPNIPMTVQFRLRHKNGEWRDFTVVCTNLLENPTVNGVVCNFHDITEIKRKELEIKYMVHHDYLTGLPNRRAFEERLDLEIKLAAIDNRKFAVLILNLDGFKYLNDTFGHDIGDLLLKKIASKVSCTLFADIEMMARIGGDEFAIMTTTIQTTDTLERIANSLLTLLEQPIEVKNYQLYLTASIGISVFPESGEESGTLMKNAGLALYLAEKDGLHTYRIYSPTANVGTYKLFNLRNELQYALYADQFLVYYQPIVLASTDEIIGVEALIRWDHPVWGIVGPNEFIPLAEESGFIIKIGEWVLKTVCRQLRLWHDAGFMVKGSVNLSLMQFLQTDLIEMVRETLEENELDPKWLNLEITETATLVQKDRVLEKVARLRALGIQISLDDFGTGYASFQNMLEIKPDILKIDRSLVKDIPSDINSTEIVTAIVQLAHRLSMKVVVEGIETVEQKEFVLGLECQKMQGYLFSKPVSKEDMGKLLERTMTPEIESVPEEDRGTYFRIDFQYPLEAMMTISELNGNKVQVGNTKVVMENLGPGGLRFLSTIKLPVSSEMILKFQTTLFDEDLTMYGKIIYASEFDTLNQYGVEILVDEQGREFLIKQFNRLQVQLRNHHLVPGCPFVTENIFSYFK